MSRIERILIVLGLIIVLLHVAGAFMPAPWVWGFHHYAYLPRVLLLLPLLSLFLLLPPVARSLGRAVEPLARAAESRRTARLVAVAFVAFMTGLFVVGRTRTFLLSDSQLLVRSVNQGFVSFTADTLAAAVQLWFHVLVRDFLHVTSQTASFRILSIASGVVWLVAACFTAARLTRNGWQRLLLVGLLGTAGLTKMFYGYAETAPLLVAAVGLYIWAAIRVLQDGRGIVFATLSFLAAAGLHVTGLLLLPSFLFVLWRWAGGDRRRVVAASAIGLLPVVTYVGFWFSRGGTPAGVARAYAPYFTEFIPLTGPLGLKQPYTLFSGPRLADFLNEQIYLGPLALLALVGAWLARRRGGETARPAAGFLFLIFVLVPFLLLSFLFNRKLGGARDWDLVASLAVPSILLTAMLLFREGESDGRARRAATLPATALFLIGVSIVHLAGAILVDTQEEWSVRRFAGLFEEGAPVSRFARSYALEEIGHYYIDRGQPRVAAGWLEKAVAADPSNAKAAGTLGSWYASAGRQAEALPLLREAVRLAPQVALGHYNLGAAFAGMSRWDDAARAYDEAIRLDPRLLDAWIGLCLARNKAGRYAEAESTAKKALKLYPGDRRNAALQATRGTALEYQGKLGDAEGAYAEAVRIDPDNGEALFNLGRLRVTRQAWSEAVAPLERLASLDPADAEAAVNLGVAYLKLGRPAPAEDAFKRAIRANPRLVDGYLNLAGLYEQSGRNADAAGVLQIYAGVDPEGAARLGLGPIIDNLRKAAAVSSP